LRGCEDDDRDIRLRHRLGRVEPAGGIYRLRLADDPDAGRITRDVDHYGIDASPKLRQDATVEILLLAAAFTVAWSPPHG
jgi:hypothetical protein